MYSHIVGEDRGKGEREREREKFPELSYRLRLTHKYNLNIYNKNFEFGKFIF